MSKCIRCNSDRLVFICGKTSDCFNLSYPDKSLQYDGYVPSDIGIVGKDNSGDYIEFSYCLECGQIQDKFPIDEQKVMQIFDEGRE